MNDSRKLLEIIIVDRRILSVVAYRAHVVWRRRTDYSGATAAGESIIYTFASNNNVIENLNYVIRNEEEEEEKKHPRACRTYSVLFTRLKPLYE